MSSSDSSMEKSKRLVSDGRQPDSQLKRVRGDGWRSVIVSCCCEKLVAVAGDSSGTQRKGNVHSWKQLPRND
jgi:hypothetical protein